MSEIRRRFRVAWDDKPEVIVITSARDVAAISKYLHPDTEGKIDFDQAWQSDPMMPFRLVHAALVRTGGHDDVPTEFDTFVDLMDVCEALDTKPANVGPTRPAASGRRPST